MFTHFVVPLDGSEFAESALPFVSKLAKQCGAKITIVRVVRPPQWEPMLRAELPEMVDKVRKAADDQARDYMKLHADQLRADGLEVECRVYEAENIARVITDVADEVGSDGIVMATHGRTGIEHVMLGSVAERVVRFARMPVLLIKPDSP